MRTALALIALLALTACGHIDPDQLAGRPAGACVDVDPIALIVPAGETRGSVQLTGCADDTVLDAITLTGPVALDDDIAPPMPATLGAWSLAVDVDPSADRPADGTIELHLRGVDAPVIVPVIAR